jgi:16S rRNA (uracil1498-N3)-methyltransferase
MRLHRFYLQQKIQENAKLITSQDELLHQWTKVFRLRVGDEVVIFDGSGDEFHATFIELSKSKAELEVSSVVKKAFVPNKEVFLFVSIIKKDNFEWIVQKATELGVSHIVPLLSERSEKKNINMERLTKISIEASEQSGRGTVPHIYTPANLPEVLNIFKDIPSYVADVGDVNSETRSLTAMKTDERVGIYIGPEGGWRDNERKMFRENNIKTVSFGEQVLRAETAAISTCALLLLKD